MDKLETLQVDLIKRCCRVARALSMESFAIDGNIVRGQAEGGMLLVHELDDEIIKIGVSRASTLFNRLTMMGEGGEFTMHTEKNDKDEIVRLVMKAKGTKLDFKCASPERIRAPKALKDKVVASFNITVNTLQMLRKASSAMSVKHLSFIVDDSSVTIRLVDDQNDEFRHVAADASVKTTNDYEDKQTFTYDLKNFLQVLKDSGENGEVCVTKRGFLLCQYEGLTVLLAPSLGD